LEDRTLNDKHPAIAFISESIKMEVSFVTQYQVKNSAFVLRNMFKLLS